MNQVAPARTAQFRSVRQRTVLAVVATATLAGSLLTVAATGALTARAAKGVVISTDKTSKYGTILVSGTTLYTLKANSTPCGATCLKYWPPVLLPKGASKPTAGLGVSTSHLGTVTRSNGSVQVTYGGKALYHFFQDKTIGQVKGVVTDTWGKWSVVVIKAKTSGSGGPTTTSPPAPTTTVTTTVPKTTTTAPSSGGGGSGGGGSGGGGGAGF